MVPKEIILHCTDTPAGRQVTVADITAWHRQRGFRTIGYHWLVDINGDIHQGRKENEVGAHCLGHNDKAIGIVYAGGRGSDGKPCDTRTVAQKIAIRNLIADIRQRYGWPLPVYGHYQFAAKACPCFKVPEEL